MSAPALHDLQRRFQSFLLNGDEQVVERIVGTPAVDARTRLGIYGDAYRLRLLEALRVDYPALHTLAGDDNFERIGRAYIAAHPSRHFSIRWFGHGMAEFLATDARFRATPVLAEMAAFEWALGLSFDAADSGAVTAEVVGALPPAAWAGMRVHFQPALQRLDLVWNVTTLWNAIQEEQPPQAPVAAEHPRAWIIWRRELRSHFRSAAVDEAWALDALRGGECFGEVCAGLCEWHAESGVAVQAAGFLRRWVDDGLVARVELD